MSYISERRPLCRFCGEGIKKVTHTHYFGQRENKVDDFSSNHVETPTSKADAQRLLNGTVVSVRRDSVNPALIWVVTTWDGETWADEFFCGNDHARQFAYAAARSGQVMPAYQDAKAKQK